MSVGEPSAAELCSKSTADPPAQDRKSASLRQFAPDLSGRGLWQNKRMDLAIWHSSEENG